MQIITNIHEAKTHLSKYVELASLGEEIIICKAGKPMAKLIQYYESVGPRKLGFWQGKVTISKDFDKFPESLQKSFYGESIEEDKEHE